MTDTIAPCFSFNLWHKAWLPLERADGIVEAVSIAHALLHAHEYIGIVEQSPLVVVGLHRLLTAIVQDIYMPQKMRDLTAIQDAGRFDAGRVNAFGAAYADRFDLFDTQKPFMQSADIPPERPREVKTIAYLAFEEPAGTETTHFRHGTGNTHAFCPACAALLLAGVPAFATSGGKGIKPSINGVPPLYMLPAGAKLFESLAASILLPAYQPDARAAQRDDVWWRREPIIPRSSEVHQVGYLHSLTFAARRMRLYPEVRVAPCTRCGVNSDTLISAMTFEMGEWRAKDAPWWQDPFAAYRQRGNKEPVPLRPVAGKALWREYHALLLSTDAGGKEKSLRPRVLSQAAALADRGAAGIVRVRCIGMRTDMKAKVFEWVDASLSASTALLMDEMAGIEVHQGLEYANECESALRHTFKDAFDQRHSPLVSRMSEAYWLALATPFYSFVIAVAKPEAQNKAAHIWRQHVYEMALSVFEDALGQIGDDAANLRKRVDAENRCRASLRKILVKYQPPEATDGATSIPGANNE